MDEEPEGKIELAIHVAETGLYFKQKFSVSTTIHNLQNRIASIVHINPQDQLLLCGHMRLEPQRTLSSYQLSSDQWNVFLFNRKRLLPDSSPPLPEHILVKELTLPRPPSAALLSHPLSDVDLSSVHAYLTHFNYHFQKASAFSVCSRDKFDICKRLLKEQQVQSLAMDAAKSNVNHFFGMIEKSYGEFTKRYHVQHKQHADLLVNFERDLERLRACKLHPIIASEKWRSLLDFVDESRLRKKLESCTSSHKQLQTKVLRLKTSYSQLRCNIQDLLNVKPTVDLQLLGQLIIEHARMMEEQHVILQSLSKDVDTVRRLACPPGSLRSQDAIAALGPMHDVHEKNQLLKMQVYHEKLEKLLNFFKSQKQDLAGCLHLYMQKVAFLQSSIRDMHNQLSAFSEAMNHQDDLFSDLRVVRKVGPSYKACLAEVVRRKASMKLYMGQAGQLAEMMAKLRADEVARRDEFLRVQSAFLPHDMLVSMGLFSVPSLCTVNIEPYDTNLIDFCIEDLEKYAPEALCGPYLRASVSSNLHADSDEPYQSKHDTEAFDGISSEVFGTSKLEVENAWLKAEYASALALLCSIDSASLIMDDNGDPQQSDGTIIAKRTMEALSLKDEHAKHLQNMLNASQSQCNIYEKRIRELEQRLSDRYNQLNGLVSDSFEVGSVEVEVSVITNEKWTTNSECPFVQMDEVASDREPCVSIENEASKESLGGDATMDKNFMIHGESKVEKDKVISGDSILSSGLMVEVKPACSEFKADKADEHASLHQAVLQAEDRCVAREKQLDAVLEEVALLKEELQKKTALLNECYINCASLESNLLSAREEAQANQCLATRKVAEYTALRASTVKLRGLVERLRHSVLMSQSGLMESLQLFADSLNRDGNADDVTEEFRRCMLVLVERVRQLVHKQNGPVQLSYSMSGSGSPADLRTQIDFLKEQYERQRFHKHRN
ncbi:hypothetical protein KP509_25G050100 [Ceratopteris richardii]|uniref:Autophagy protein ATG17-like domain-containing protein n=1 Tax=Ceratopteris richardii TaxID=49495 RepID=A0A8T2RSF4_CERRI|nr:hypothetical protein KP509_25G050100 [Ceratopteris richardii]